GRGGADADRVPAARTADGAPRRGGSSARPGACGLAARRDRPREHDRCVHGAVAAEAEASRARERDRDRARGGGSPGVSRLGLGRRLVLAVSAAVTVAIVGLVGAFNVILGSVLERDARDLVRTRAVAQIDSLRIDHGRLVVREASDDRAADAY